MKTILFIIALSQSCLFAAPGDVRWSFDAGGPIRSSAAFGTNGWIIFGTLNGNVYAVNPVGGRLEWRKAAGSGVLSSPCIAPDGRVFIGTSNELLVLNGKTGATEWSFKTNLPGALFPLSSEVISTPTILGNERVFFSIEKGALFSLDARTGAIQWTSNLFQFQPLTKNYSSPVLDRNGMLFFGSSGSYVPSAGGFSAFDAQSGQRMWNITPDNWIQSTPAIGEDGTVFASGNDRIVYAFDPKTGVPKWTNVLGDSMTSSPVLGPDGTLYVGANDGRLYALDSATGKQKWRFLAKDTIHSTPAVAADGTVYFGSYDKNVYALDGATGTNKWTFTTGHFVLSSPLIGPDGTVYIGSYDNMLYALEGTAPLANSAWPMFKGNVRHTGAAEDRTLNQSN